LTEPVRLDAHHHVWDLTVRDQPWTAGRPALRRSFEVADLRPFLIHNGIGATILVQTITVPEETPELLALASTEPVIAGVVGWVDLTAPDLPDRLASLRALPGGGRLAGIRHQVQEEPDPRWLCRRDVRGGLAAVGAAGLVYDLLVTAEQLPAVIETVRALPEVRFVLDHAGNPPVATEPGQLWRTRLRELGTLPNVAVKLSGLVTRGYPGPVLPDVLRSWTDLLLGTFGPDRLMFGSDWPVCTLSASYDEVMRTAERATKELSDSERADIFGRTAARSYGVTGA
jgi:L-fuconolactonase